MQIKEIAYPFRVFLHEILLKGFGTVTRWDLLKSITIGKIGGHFERAKIRNLAKTEF